MAEIMWQARTKRQIDAYIAAPSHALMLVGQAGSGKQAITDYILAHIIDPHSPYISRIIPDNGSISIASIREIEKMLTLKVPSNNTINRVIIIERADTLTGEAQNALLKSLEEPPLGTVFILTCDDITRILPTILSRVTEITVQLPDTQTLQQYFASLDYDPKTIDRVLLQSGGLPGLTTALLQDTEHPLIAAAQQAKMLLSASRFDKLLVIEALAKSREETINTVSVMQRITQIQLRKARGKAVQQWAHIGETCYKCQVMLHANAQPKIVLDYLCLNV